MTAPFVFPQAVQMRMLVRGPGHRRNSCRFKTKQGPGSGERVSSWGIGPESGADQPVIRAETADFGGTREDSSAEGVSRLTEGPSGGADFTAGATPSLTCVLSDSLLPGALAIGFLSSTHWYRIEQDGEWQGNDLQRDRTGSQQC
ncbi:hypothetical protein TREES_T100016626 [Tupaia chinensis]|uniref:Uncharacterized protein n=1 Tax=Tupaia chinensis TaxID=246437 RepID=L9L8R5_TUPCH|nr:hypothetical protein TREES_T100016626 [Tupaia chinensis]